MTSDDIIEKIKKLEYHVSILGQAIDYARFPIESLIMSMDWGPGDISKAHDIFERWDRHLTKGGALDGFEFENDFDVALGVSYQGLKSIIISFWENHQWTNVCEAYVNSFDGSPAIEYHRIMRRER